VRIGTASSEDPARKSKDADEEDRDASGHRQRYYCSAPRAASSTDSSFDGRAQLIPQINAMTQDTPSRSSSSASFDNNIVGDGQRRIHRCESCQLCFRGTRGRFAIDSLIPQVEGDLSVTGQPKDLLVDINVNLKREKSMTFLGHGRTVA
jgi:hypothetical protein